LSYWYFRFIKKTASFLWKLNDLTDQTAPRPLLGKEIAQAPVLVRTDLSRPALMPPALASRRCPGYPSGFALARSRRCALQQSTSAAIGTGTEHPFGRWVLDLSASALWSHLNHWGRTGKLPSVRCDASKPPSHRHLRATKTILQSGGRAP
jgi:hypothetical protein